MSSVFKCPSCGTDITPAEVPARPPVALDYLSCLRRCDACGIGFSNARQHPTLIYREPLHNVPAEVRSDASAVLAAALNKTNRANKRRKFGFSTSEDAVTWTVFSYAATRAPEYLFSLGERLFGLAGIAETTLLLWGVPVPASVKGQSLHGQLIQVLNQLGENEACLSEPDVVVDYGDAGVVVVEIKLHAPNDVCRAESLGKFDRYLHGTPAFAAAERARVSGLYELTRNWRIGWDLAGGRPFRLINLGPRSLFRASERLDDFRASLASDRDASFREVSWDAFLECMRSGRSALPPWLEDWLRARLPADPDTPPSRRS